MDNQYVTLSSRAYSELYSQNSANKFTTQFVPPLDLSSGDYEVALIECILMFKTAEAKEATKAEEKLQTSCLLCSAVRPRRFLETYLPILRILKPGSKTAQLENLQYVNVMPNVYSELTIELVPLAAKSKAITPPHLSLPSDSIIFVTLNFRRRKRCCALPEE